MKVNGKTKRILIVLICFITLFTKSSLTIQGDLINNNTNKRKCAKEVSLGGYPVGIKLKTKGLIVISLSQIDINNGKSCSPALDAGIGIGDNLIKINDIELNSPADITKIISESTGEEINVEILRNGVAYNKKVTPIKDKDNNYKLGVWVRDSTAGVGTLTFYDSKNNLFGALGHGIVDGDTNIVMPVGKGELVGADISSIRKGERGNPGELKGVFSEDGKLEGEIKSNTNYGVFGTINKNTVKNGIKKTYKIANCKEIKIGDAKILTTVDNYGPKMYNISIQKIIEGENGSSKNLLIVVTDQELLEKTGGIVQGMSGSPIIQNDKIIGAVNHVLVNKPDTGYGIFIETMINELNKAGI